MSKKNIIIIILSFMALVVGICLSVQLYKTNTQLNSANEKIIAIEKDLDESNQKLDECNKELDECKGKLKKAKTTIKDLKSDEYEFIYLGEYKLTYYCDMRFSHICGGSGITATGKPTEVGTTIAVNPNDIPYGSKVYIEGIGFRSADDTGGGIGRKHIDVLVKTHDEALSQTLLKSGVWLLVKK